MTKQLGLIGAILFLLTDLATAGASSGGGGHAVVCRDANNKIKTAELLDIYEMQKWYELIPMKASGNIKTDYVRGFKHAYRLMGYPAPPDEDIAVNVDLFLQASKFIGLGDHLPFDNDTGPHSVLPDGCELEQLALYYDGEDAVEIDSEIWHALDSLSQAALIDHELTYKMYRKRGSIDSGATRAYVAYEFADENNAIGGAIYGLPSSVPLDSIDFKIPGEKENQAAEFRTDFYRFPDPNQPGHEIVQFTQIFGLFVLERAYISYDTNIAKNEAEEQLPIHSRQFFGWTAEAYREKDGHISLRFFDGSNNVVGNDLDLKNK